MVKNKCPYLENHKKCVHKYNRGDCNYNNPEKCPLWKESPSEIISFTRMALNRLKALCGKRSDNE